MSKNLHQSEQLHFIIASLVILKCSENLCCISAAFDDFLSFCLLCSFQGTPDLTADITQREGQV